MSQVSIVIGTRGLALLATFAMTITIARVLAPEASGAFFLIYTTVALAATIGRFGTDNLVLKLGSDARGASASVTRRLLAILVLASALVAAALGVFAVVFRPALGILPELSSFTLFAVSFSVVPLALSVFAGAALRGSGRVPLGVVAELGSVPLLTTVGVIILDQSGSAGLDAVLLVMSAAAALTALWSMPAALWNITAQHSASSAEGRAAPIISARSLASMMGTSLLFYLLTWAPIYVLGFAASVEDVADYTVAARLAAFVQLGATIQTSYLAPEFAGLARRGLLPELNAVCRRSTNRVSVLAAFIALPLVIAPAPLLELFYGGGYAAAAPALAVLAAAAVAVTACGQVNQLMLLCDLEHAALALNVAALASWAVLGIPCGALWGLMGVAVFAGLVSVAYAVSAAVTLVRQRRIHAYARAWEVA